MTLTLTDTERELIVTALLNLRREAAESLLSPPDPATAYAADDLLCKVYPEALERGEG